MKITAARITRSKWSSERAFVLATAAAAVGLGNIWRFPYIAGENGGAAFILAYIISVIGIGIPLMLVEISAGNIKRGSPVHTFRQIHASAGIIGWMIVGLTMLILSYYLVITGWTFGYALNSLTGEVPTFEAFTSGYNSLIFFALVSGITVAVVARGTKAIEVLSTMLMPLLFAIILAITGYSLTLDGASEAVTFLFSPNFSALFSLELWVLAIGQAFYSLAIGQGFLITYGSFLPEKINLPRSTSVIAGFETAVAIIAGLMIFPLIFTFDLNPGQGSELAFNTLPLAFASIPYGATLAILFFWLFFLAAISSSIAALQVVKTAMREELRLTHGWATTAALLPILPLGVLAAMSFTPAEFTVLGRPFLEVLDMFAANQIVIALGLLGGAVISRNMSSRVIINHFSNRHRHLASYVIAIARYLWLAVAGVLLLSVAV